MHLGIWSLLKKRTFFPLFITQFLGAFNDNAYKLAMLTLISYFLSTSQMQSEVYQAMASGLFILPFFLLSAIAGQLADKLDKSHVTRVIKLFEVFLMISGGFGLYLGDVFIMMATLTGMGIHSTFFGPIKYAILPDHLAEESLLGATALIESSTFLAILLGTILGTLSIVGAGSNALYAIVLTCTAAILGLIASYFIPKAPSSAKVFSVDWHVIRATIQMLREVMRNRRVIPAFLAISWFWLIGTVVLTKLPDYANYVLRADTSVFAVFLALFSMGIATGSFAINRFLKGACTLKYVPHAMILLSYFACDIYWATPIILQRQPLLNITTFFSEAAHIRIAVDLFLMAVAAGLFVVPLYTFLQIASEGAFRARTIAVNNIVNALFMVIGAGFVMGLLSMHVAIPEVFLILGLLNLCAAIVIYYLIKRWA